MDLRHLEYFVAVVEEGTFTRAAERLHVAQPGVSAQIRRLEAELGEQLLDRSGPRTRPTEVGAAVLPHARAALAAAERVRATVQERTGLLSGSVSVGAVSGILAADLGLADLLAGFHADHPAVDISLREQVSAVLYEQLRAGELDLAIAALGDTPPDGLEVHALTDDALVAVVAPDHPLAGRTSVALATLAGEPLICMPRRSSLRETIERGFARAGVTPTIAFEGSDPIGVTVLAGHGLGVGIVPEPVGRTRADRVSVIELTRPALRGRLALCWPTGGPASPAARALLERARGTLA